MSEPRIDYATTHKPGPGGLFDNKALCGSSAQDAPLRMHEWDYNCPVCSQMAGEK